MTVTSSSEFSVGASQSEQLELAEWLRRGTLSRYAFMAIQVEETAAELYAIGGMEPDACFHTACSIVSDDVPDIIVQKMLAGVYGTRTEPAADHRSISTMVRGHIKPTSVSKDRSPTEGERLKLKHEVGEAPFSESYVLDKLFAVTSYGKAGASYRRQRLTV